MEIGTQDLYSLRIALNQLSYTKKFEREREREREGGGALGCVLALRRLFLPTKQKHKTQHGHTNKTNLTARS